MAQEIVLYDFCGTLVDFQTANAFVNYVKERTQKRRTIIEYIRLILNRLGLLQYLNRFSKKISINKALLLRQLKGESKDEMDSLAREFYNSRIKKHFIPVVLNRLIQDLKEQKTVVVISGGYDIYLRYFAKDFNIPYLICTSLKFKNNQFTGKISGNDCMGDEKVIRLNKMLSTISPKSEDKRLTLYSDSDSDLPLFNICDNKIAVIQGKDIPLWTKEMNPHIMTY